MILFREITVHNRYSLLRIFKNSRNYSLRCEKCWILQKFERFPDKKFQLRHSILTSSSHTAVQAGIRRLETSATRAFPNDSILVLGEHERIQLLFRNLHGVVRLMETAIYCLRVTKLFCPERFRDSQIVMKFSSKLLCLFTPARTFATWLSLLCQSSASLEILSEPTIYNVTLLSETC